MGEFHKPQVGNMHFKTKLENIPHSLFSFLLWQNENNLCCFGHLCLVLGRFLFHLCSFLVAVFLNLWEKKKKNNNQGVNEQKNDGKMEKMEPL